MEGGEALPGQNSGNITGDPEVIRPRRHDGRANLRPPWQKGRSGNPGGRPKKGPLTDALALLGNKRAPDEILNKLPASIVKLMGKRPTMAQILMFRLMTQAIGGDVGATRLIFDRLEGKALQSVQDEDGGQIDSLISALAAGGVPEGGVNDE